MTLGFIRGGLLTASALFAFSSVGQAETLAVQNTHAKAQRVLPKGTDRSLDILYDQTSNDSGSGTFSQNIGDGQSSAAADDFTVPAETRWTVQEVDVLGKYFNGYGPADSVEVVFYKAKGHKPGKLIAQAEVVPASDNNGSFTLQLAQPVKLKPGHYWLSVVANMDFVGGAGEWQWENQTTTEGDPAVWQGPGGKCTTWKVQSKCFGSAVGDQMFTLKGNAK